LVPTKFHLEYVLAASAKGKHVFCEKPCALTPEEVLKMINARQQYKNIIQVGLVFRSAPQILYLKKLVLENAEKWGKITNIIFRDSQEKPYKGALEVHNSTWRSDKNLAHGGILFEHTIHDIDGMIFIMGEIGEVFARINYYAGIDGIEDSVAAILTFKSGINLSVNSIWNDIDYSVRRFEIFFERAYVMITVDERNDKFVEIRVKYLKDTEYILKDDEMDLYFRQLIGKTHIKAEITGPYYYEDLRFIDAIVDPKKRPADITLEHAFYAQKVIEACYESNRTKKIVKMDDFIPKE
jgi:predicted dehydrogenase